MTSKGTFFLIINQLKCPKNGVHYKPELIVKRMVFPVGAKTGWHHHNVINYGIVEQGELTIVCQDGNERTFRQGEAITEVIGTVHRGENRGNCPVVLNMFYVSAPGLVITEQHRI